VGGTDLPGCGMYLVSVGSTMVQALHVMLQYCKYTYIRTYGPPVLSPRRLVQHVLRHSQSVWQPIKMYLQHVYVIGPGLPAMHHQPAGFSVNSKGSAGKS
jgi:hypothetical protein